MIGRSLSSLFLRSSYRHQCHERILWLLHSNRWTFIRPQSSVSSLESVVISEEERNESTNHPDNCHDNKNSDDLKQEQNGNSTISNEMDTTITSLPKNSVLRSNLPKKHSGDDDNASGSTTVDGRKKAAWNVYLKIQDFARSGQLERATELLESLQQHDSQAVGMGAQHILQGYSRRLMVDSLRSRRDDAVHAAEQLVQKLEERGVLDDVSHKKLLLTMSKIYSWTKKPDKLQKMLPVFRDNSTDGLWMELKVLSQNNKIEAATELLKTVLLGTHKEYPAHSVTVPLILTVLRSWEVSETNSNRFQEAYKILRFLESSNIAKLGLRLNTIIYNHVLRCLPKSNTLDAGRVAISLLDEMEGKSNCTPDQQSYNLAIKTCLQTNNGLLVDTLFERMKMRNIQPGVRTYNETLVFWSKNAMASPMAAERAERILLAMRNQAVRHDRQMAPNVISYSIVISAWARADQPNSLEKMWLLYRCMRYGGIKPDFIILSTLIAHFSRSNKLEFIQRADKFLEYLENGNIGEQSTSTANYLHYTNVIKGYISVGEGELACKVFLRSVEAFVVSKNKNASLDGAILYMLLQDVAKTNVSKATAVLCIIQKYYKAGILPTVPTRTTYQMLLAEWSKAPSKQYPDKESNIAKLEAMLAELPASHQSVDMMSNDSNEAKLEVEKR